MPTRPPQNQNAGNRIGNALARYGTQYSANQQHAQQAGTAIAAYGNAFAQLTGQAPFNAPLAVPPAPAAPAPAPQAPAGAGAAPEAPRQFVPDSIYNDTLGFNKKTHDNTITGLDDAERTLKFQFDDPTNPFSRTAEAKRNYLQRSEGITNNLAARGQTFSGVHTRRQENNRHNEEADAAATKAAYTAALEGIKARRTGADTSREGLDLEAWKDAMRRQGLA